MVSHPWFLVRRHNIHSRSCSALEFRKWLGGEDKINAYCHDLAIKGGKVLAAILGTREMDPESEMTLNMVYPPAQSTVVVDHLLQVNVELPLPPSLKHTIEVDTLIKDKLFLEHKASSAYFHHNNAWWTRCSAQVWNEVNIISLHSTTRPDDQRHHRSKILKG